MDINGSCHCRNISFVLTCPPDFVLAARACTCTFCRKHGGVWTSCPQGTLTIQVRDDSQLSRYMFGTKTAHFYTCRECGVAPLVTSEIEGRLYAVVSINAFDDFDRSRLSATATSFDGEGTDDRLARRRRNWIGTVRIVPATENNS